MVECAKHCLYIKLPANAQRGVPPHWPASKSLKAVGSSKAPRHREYGYQRSRFALARWTASLMAHFWAIRDRKVTPNKPNPDWELLKRWRALLSLKAIAWTQSIPRRRKATYPTFSSVSELNGWAGMATCSGSKPSLNPRMVYTNPSQNRASPFYSNIHGCGFALGVIW